MEMTLDANQYSVAAMTRCCTEHLGWLLLLLTGCVDTMTSAVAQTTIVPPRYYYSIENIQTGEIIRRGKTGQAGLARGDVILAPNQDYRIWLLDPQPGLLGYEEFSTPDAGFRFDIPTVALGLPQQGDSDRDGLTDDAEFILGSDAGNADTDGDGIEDGRALALGLDPGAAARTGIIGAADTPGTAVDICAFNDIVVLADSTTGISVFNVFNRMAPVIIAQVETPGTATAVAYSGTFVAVADGDSGLAIIDIRDPPNARIVQQLGMGGFAQAVSLAGDLAFVGTREGKLFSVEVSSGAVLQQVNLGGRVEDVTVEGQVIYTYANNKLQALRLVQGVLQTPASVDSPAPQGINAANGRGRIFVGGGIAYLVHTRGYNTFDVSNPTQPSLLLQGLATPPQFGWKQVALSGANRMVAATSPNQGFDGPHDLSIYTVTDPSVFGSFITRIPSAGVTRAVAIYNGLAYTAVHENGLQVINYLTNDYLRVPPTGLLTSTIDTNLVPAGSRVFFTAQATDDVQVRNVEFYVNGIKTVTDGSYPFEFVWRAPGTNGVGSHQTITAIVSDTGGNRTNLNTFELIVGPDTLPPSVVINSPVPNQVLTYGDDLFVNLTALDNVGVESIEFILDGQVVEGRRLSLSDYLVRVPLISGQYGLSVRVTDSAGLVTTSPLRSFSVVREAISREVSVFNFGAADRPDAISREVSVFNFGAADKPEAISREVSVQVVPPAAPPPPPNP